MVRARSFIKSAFPVAARFTGLSWALANRYRGRGAIFALKRRAPVWHALANAQATDHSNRLFAVRAQSRDYDEGPSGNYSTTQQIWANLMSMVSGLAMLGRAIGYACGLARNVPLLFKYRDATMVGKVMFLENLTIAKRTLRKPNLVDGAVVECGTWKGGMAAALMEIGGSQRRYYFFDSFEGLPPAGDMDGEAARRYQSAKDSKYNNCTASIDEFKATITRTDLPIEKVKIYKGWFNQTFSDFDPPPVAVLRLDADWYSSTMTCLTKFWDAVIPGGLIIIDDYGTWEGCTKAVHEFLSMRKATEPIRQTPAGVTFIEKSCHA